MSASEWISCKDEMPDAETTVLINCPNADEPVWLGYHDCETWRSIDGEKVHVTHWMPLPVAPQ